MIDAAAIALIVCKIERPDACKRWAFHQVDARSKTSNTDDCQLMIKQSCLYIVNPHNKLKK